MRFYLRWMEWKLKLLSASMGILSPLPLMLSLKGLMPVMLGAGLSTVMFLGFLSYGRRSENYKKRLKNTYDQIQKQIQEMGKIYPDKRIEALVVNTTNKSFYYRNLKMVPIKELCHEVLGLLHTA
jgi:uncharacterized membrane protein YgaE (UPF0421/DUF939 family)